MADLDKIVYIVINIRTILNKSYSFLFTNKACNTIGYDDFDDWEKYKSCIDWPLFNETPL